MIDALADFQSEPADLEKIGDDEPLLGGGLGHIDAEHDTSDLEPDHDDEYDYRMNERH